MLVKTDEMSQESSGGGTRTRNPPVNSRMLCQIELPRNGPTCYPPGSPSIDSHDAPHLATPRRARDSPSLGIRLPPLRASKQEVTDFPAWLGNHALFDHHVPKQVSQSERHRMSGNSTMEVG
jgi:hypothetical protein